LWIHRDARVAWEAILKMGGGVVVRVIANKQCTLALLLPLPLPLHLIFISPSLPIPNYCILISF
jgi:hypothetical protein